MIKVPPKPAPYLLSADLPLHTGVDLGSPGRSDARIGLGIRLVVLPSAKPRENPERTEKLISHNLAFGGREIYSRLNW
jgi:hypothetical protein